MRRLLFVMTFLLLLNIGCSRLMPQATPLPTPIALEKIWSVKMTLSGGIAGLMRSIEVTSDGSYTVSDERAGITITGEMEKSELKRLEDLLSILEINPLTGNSACADCFVYDIEIHSNGETVTAGADDITLGDSGMGSLVQFLQDMMNNELKQQ